MINRTNTRPKKLQMTMDLSTKKFKGSIQPVEGHELIFPLFENQWRRLSRSPENFFAVLIVIDTGKGWRQQRQQKEAAQCHCQGLGLQLSEMESSCHLDDGELKTTVANIPMNRWFATSINNPTLSKLWPLIYARESTFRKCKMI